MYLHCYIESPLLYLYYVRITVYTLYWALDKIVIVCDGMSYMCMLLDLLDFLDLRVLRDLRGLLAYCKSWYVCYIVLIYWQYVKVLDISINLPGYLLFSVRALYMLHSTYMLIVCISSGCNTISFSVFCFRFYNLYYFSEIGMIFCENMSYY